MARFLAAFLFAAPLCAIATIGSAQDDPILAPLNPSVGAPAKAHPRKSSHKSGGAVERAAQPNADGAARLAEGRKKFFEQSMGFDNGKSGSSPVTLGGDNGLSPAMGLKF